MHFRFLVSDHCWLIIATWLSFMFSLPSMKDEIKENNTRSFDGAQTGSVLAMAPTSTGLSFQIRSYIIL